MSNTFNARFVSTFSPDRIYRVHVDRGEVYGIRIGGQGGVAEGIGLNLGLLGVFLMRAMQRKSEEKLAARAADVDRQHPSAMLCAHKHNFHTSAGDIQRSSLDPPAALRLHGEHFGRWRLRLRDGKEMTFQLETLEDMRLAYQLLPSLGRVHLNNVAYNHLSKKFMKAPSQEMAGVSS